MARDGFQLVQEAVANWESLPGVRGVEVVELWLDNSTERSFLAKVNVDGQAEYVQLTLVAPAERAEALPGYDDLDEEWLGDQAAALYDVHQFADRVPRVGWQGEGWE